MKVGYTEFSFGYAFTENLIRNSASSTTGAPIFPNLIQEAALGYDVRIDFPAIPLFFQYKLPELMTRTSAFEIANGHCLGLTPRFFRIALMRRDQSNQHKLLIDREKLHPGCVFYAAPGLHNSQEFNHAYNAASVPSHSMLFSPEEIGPLPDDQTHTIAFKPGLTFGYFCSAPRKIEATKFENLIDNLTTQFTNRTTRNFRDMAPQLRQDIIKAASPVWQQAQHAVADRTRRKLQIIATAASDLQSVGEEAILDVLVAREIARIDLGIDLIIAQPS